MSPTEIIAEQRPAGERGRRWFKSGLWAALAWIVAWNTVTLLIFFG